MRKKYNRRYNSQRDNASQVAVFRRSKAWKQTSKAKLQACGYKCEAKLEGCGRYACEVHHIKPLKTPEGWELRLEWSNLMGVCVQCHNKLDSKGFKKKKDEGVIDLATLSK
ncbi:MAG: HNH endonuclease [Oscillospiraceae bacterium]|nr:HNH endonuclease [Oscillospiraceae bacterium]